MWFVPTAIEPDAEVYLSFNGTAYNLTDEDEGDEFDLDNIDPLAANTTITWELLLHFDTVGQYQICFYAECKVGTCEPGTQTWSKCFDFDVKQWKDAFPIELNEKWNLISLPLVPFDSDIDVMLESLNADATDALVNVWHYDRGDDKWFAWSPNGQTQLTDIVDGKSYWFRMKYPDTKDPYTWWVWGTEKPMPEHGPAQYNVYTGWNMAGFVSLSSMLVEDYLWNWTTPFPVVYGWTPDPDWADQGWYLVPAGDSLNSGEGYWMAFPSNGAIYAP